MKILDCTLRDGGYYNNWDFDKSTVASYINSIVNGRIDEIELGLRNFEEGSYRGPFYFTTDSFINSLDLPEARYGVMVDAKTIINSGVEIKQAVNSLFLKKEDSKVSFVRLAFHFSEIIKGQEIALLLNDLGYDVYVNLMQISEKDEFSIKKVVSDIKKWGVVKVLYFADSLGNMSQRNVEGTFDIIRSEWDGVIGIHTHNNMSQALQNSKKAIDIGVEYIDATVTGMGRGAGNTPTEMLLAELSDKLSSKYNKHYIYDLAFSVFEPLREKYGWGYHFMYHISAQLSIHPMYIQKLLSDSHFTKEEVLAAIEYLPLLRGETKYSEENLARLTVGVDYSHDGLFGSISGIFDNSKVIIIAGGDGYYDHKEAVLSYIDKVEPIVVSLNVVDQSLANYIDYYVISHNVKFLTQSELLRDLNSKIIMPVNRFSPEELKAIQLDNDVFDYAVEVVENEFSWNDVGVKVPYDITFAFLLSVLANSCPEKVSLVGFDGYEKGDSRQKEMVDLIERFKSKSDAIQLTALTPTTYPISESSIYAPVI
ncbi:MAG: hypothetical protein JXR18_12255 [Neptuniibacter sp.]